MSKKKIKKSKQNRKFKIFVKILNEEGFFDETKFGWLKLNPKIQLLPFQMSEAHEFEEKEDGHGSFEDWKKFFEEDHEDWLLIPKYID